MLEHIHHIEPLLFVIGTFGLSGAAFGSLLVGAGGIGASLYGANKQSKATQEAASLNDARQAEQNAAAWANYLMTRGINPSGAQTGQIPANPQAINARLPLWATANFARPGATKTWRKKGTTAPANTLTRGASPSYGGSPYSPNSGYMPPSAPAYAAPDPLAYGGIEGMGNPIYPR